MRTAVIVLDFLLGRPPWPEAPISSGGPVVTGPRGWAMPPQSALWPGMVLLVVVGGRLLAGAILLLGNGLHTARLVSVEAGVVLVGWSGVMSSTIGYRHWAQALPFALGIAVVLPSFVCWRSSGS